jgi:hypothetical protein
MKLIALSIAAAGIFLITSCGKTTRFPVSSFAPAADIKATTKVDKNNNNVISVKAKNLASPDRIETAGNAYVIWIRTDDNQVHNLGQLRNENAQTASLTTVTPYDPKEIFITLEEQGSVSTPSGTEISRAEVIDDFDSESDMMRDDTRYDTGTESSEPFRSGSDTLR